jgi:elongation factor Ts
MPEFTAKDVQRLRQTAGVGMMDARQALTDADGDPEKALELLRVRGLAKLAKRSEREASDGAIGCYLHNQADRPVLGVLVELACETDFVAKSPEFRQVADDIAMHIAWTNPTWVRREDVDPVALEKEKDIITRQAEAEGKPANLIAKIVEGRLKAFYETHVLYDQQFVNQQRFEGTLTEMVGALASKMGENVKVRRIALLRVGE